MFRFIQTSDDGCKVVFTRIKNKASDVNATTNKKQTKQTNEASGKQ